MSRSPTSINLRFELAPGATPSNASAAFLEETEVRSDLESLTGVPEATA